MNSEKEAVFDWVFKRTIGDLDDLMNLDPENNQLKVARAALLQVKFRNGLKVAPAGLPLEIMRNCPAQAGPLQEVSGKIQEYCKAAASAPELMPCDFGAPWPRQSTMPYKDRPKDRPIPVNSASEWAGHFEENAEHLEAAGPAKGVHPRLHDALIQAYKSQAETLREEVREDRPKDRPEFDWIDYCSQSWPNCKAADKYGYLCTLPEGHNGQQSPHSWHPSTPPIPESSRAGTLSDPPLQITDNAILPFVDDRPLTRGTPDFSGTWTIRNGNYATVTGQRKDGAWEGFVVGCGDSIWDENGLYTPAEPGLDLMHRVREGKNYK